MPRPSSAIPRVAWRAVVSRRGLTPAQLHRYGVTRSMAYHLASGRSCPGSTTLALLPTTLVTEWCREMRRLLARRAR